MYRIERKVDVQLTEKEIRDLYKEYLHTLIYWRIRGWVDKDIDLNMIEAEADAAYEKVMSATTDAIAAWCDNAVANLIVNSEVRHGEQK